ncbi:MAG: NADH-quinone oxidoreductase subunit M, partial [Chloroflexi bacterium]
MTLTVIWLLPLVASVLIAFMPSRLAKSMAVLVSLATFGITIGVALVFAPGINGYQFSEQVPWIPQLHVFYHLGVDGISIWLVVLNALLMLIAVLATPVTMRNVNRFIALMLAMSAGMAGVFLAVDLVLFYVFWEAML